MFSKRYYTCSCPGGQRGWKRRQKLFLTSAFLLGATTGLHADGVLGCPTGDYETVQASYSTGCTIGDLTFSSFTPLTVPLGYTITPTDTPGAIGFDFSFGASPLTAPNSIGISYLVTGPDITDATLMMSGSAGPGSDAFISETVCPGDCAPPGLNTYVIGGVTSKDWDSAIFAPAASVAVDEEISAASGTASIMSFSNTFSQGAVPEPGFYGVLAAGMGAVLLFARRRKKTP